MSQTFPDFPTPSGQNDPERRSTREILDELNGLDQRASDLRGELARRGLSPAIRENCAYAPLVEQNPDVIARFDHAFRHLYINQSVVGVTGWTPEEIIGKTLDELGFPEDIVSLWQRNIAAVFETGARREMEFSHDWRGGVATHHVWMIPEPAPDGSVASVMTVARDISDRRRAEEELIRRKELETAILEMLPVMVVIMDREGTLQYANPDYERLTGYTLADQAKVNIVERLFPRKKIREAAFTQLHAADGDFHEYDLRTKDGALLQTAWSVMQLGQNRYLAIGLDISEQKKAEALARRAQMRFATFMDNLPGLAYIIDEHEHIVYFNEPLNTVLGIPAAAAVGKTKYDFFDTPTAADILKTERQVFASDEPVQALERVVFKPGTSPRHMLVTKFPLPVQEGEPRMLGGIAVDVTERVEAQEALAESRELYRALFEGSPLAINFFDKDGVILMANTASAELLGRTPDDLRGKQLSELLPALAESSKGAYAEAMEHETMRRETSVELNGRTRHFVTTLAPVKVRGEKPIGLLAISLETTEAKEREAELAALNNERTQVGMAAGPKLRSPLNALLGSLRLALEDKGLGSATRERIETALARAEQLTAALNNVRDLWLAAPATSTETDQVAALTPVLSSVLRAHTPDPTFSAGAEPGAPDVRSDATAGAASAAYAPSIRIAEAPTAPRAVHAQHMELLQFLHTLIDAAEETTPSEPPSAMTLTCDTAPSGCLLLRLTADDGSGFPALLEALGPDVKHPDGRTIAQKSLARRLQVFAAEIQPLPDGLELILSGVPVLSPEAPGEEEERARPFAAMRVLVVEDDPTNRAVLMGLLAHLGVKATAAPSGREAVQIARREPPFDLVFMDLAMPVMNGFDTARALHELPPFASGSVPILAVTAHNPPELDPSIAPSDKEAYERFFSGLIQKPLDMRSLSHALEAVLAQSRASRA